MIVWTERALRDLDDCLSRVGAHTSERLIERVLDAVERLDEFPLSGRGIPELEEQKVYREVIAGDLRVAYWALEDRVEILAVVHGRRLLTIDLVREAETEYRVGGSGSLPGEVPVLA